MIGSDLDARVLRGWGVAYNNKASEALDSTDVYQNFHYYNLRKPDILRVDNARPVRSVC